MKILGEIIHEIKTCLFIYRENINLNLLWTELFALTVSRFEKTANKLYKFANGWSMLINMQCSVFRDIHKMGAFL